MSEILACVASVSVGLSAGLKRFSASISVAFAPTFAPPKSEKRLERAENPTETLATQASEILKCDYSNEIY